MGVGLLLVQVVAVLDLIKRFAAAPGGAEPAEPGAEPPPSWGWIIGHGAVGLCCAVVGGHAVGDFADGLVDALTERQYPEMVGAIVVSLFAGVASYLMVATAHMKKKYDVALSNVSGAVTQVPFVILPGTMLIMALLAQLGVIPTLPHGGVLAIDLETTAVVMFGAPTLLVLWHSIQDDGKVNPLETTIMVVVFGLIIYFLGAHG
jgi:Ca2+/H+ antiporter